jgi:exopolysaccharide biosynthesis polyprenyl glycosylphosphotransferase
MERIEKDELTGLPMLKPGRFHPQTVMRGLQVLIDVIALVIAFGLGYLARQHIPLLPIMPGVTPSFGAYIPMMIIHVATVLVLFFFARLYHQRRAVSRFDTAYAVVASVSVGTIMTSGLITIFLKGTDIPSDYPRQMVLYVWLFSVICAVAGRELHRQITIRARVTGVARDRVLIVGSGDAARAIAHQIQSNADLGYGIVGLVNGNDGNGVAAFPVVGRTEDLPTLIDTHRVTEVIIALPEAPHEDLMRLIALCQRGQVSVKLYPDLFAYMTGGMSVDDLGGMPLLCVRDVALRGWKLTVKRGVDVVGSMAAMVLLSPLMLLVAVLIKLESPGPVFYVQERMGLDAHPFSMLKFRSMRQDAEQNGPGWTRPNDPRRTRLGALMRRLNIDELPQFINVLIGDMSLVGPRAERPVYVDQFRKSIPRYMDRHREKAGITGWAQVNGLRGDTSITERTKYDLWYIENWSLLLDLKILIRTVLQFFSDRNAY